MRMSGLEGAKWFRWCLAAFILTGASTTSQAKWLPIHNDFVMYDLDGSAIQVRSGCLCKFGDLYYWYGCGGGMANQTCYSSPDLWHWTNKGTMLVASGGTNRMDVVYNDSTKKYVMVMKWETPGPEWCNRGIATGTSPTGPFTKLFDSTVYGAYTGDMSVFKDDDGKAYYVYERWDNGNTNQNFSLMTWDYIGLEKKMQQWPDATREANNIMKRRGKYYYLTSGMMGIDPTLTEYWTAPSIDGPWTTKLVPVILPGDTKNDSWSTQCDFVFPFKGTKDTVFMYDGDRWKQTETIHQGGYVWLPITFSPKDSIIINYYQDWEVDPDAGTWRALDRKRDLALHKTATASSTSGSNSPNNVTDSSTWQNYMNTKWTSASSDPQWISIDLGSAMPVNRVIIKWDSAYAKAFKIQVSTDNSAWTDVYSTTKAGLRSITDETFTTATARYVRMNGTQRGTTGGYSMFEFMVLNDTDAVTAASRSGRPAFAPDAFLMCRNNRVRFHVPSDNPVHLDVVDCRGKVAAVLVDGFRHAGDHEAVLPAALGRGMFIIRLATGAKKLATMLARL